MNNTGLGLVWQDQETAEKVAGKRRVIYLELLDELDQLAEATNSLLLHRLVAERRSNLINDMGLS